MDFVLRIFSLGMHRCADLQGVGVQRETETRGLRRKRGGPSCVAMRATADLRLLTCWPADLNIFTDTRFSCLALAHQQGNCCLADPVSEKLSEARPRLLRHRIFGDDKRIVRITLKSA